MIERLRSLIAVLSVVVATLMVPGVQVAHAVPEQPWLADSPTLALTDLGLDPDLLLYGQVGTATLTVPVPAGMVPSTLNLTAQLPVDVRSATITVSQDNRVITQADIPAQRGPVVIPLGGVLVVDNAISLLVRSYLLPLDGYCLDPTNPLRLTDVSLSYTGREQVPDVVADFLPPILRKLVIYTSRRPSQTEANAVVQLATAVTSHYGKQNPTVEVAPLPAPAAQPPGSARPLERHIVVSEGPDAGVSLYPGGGMPALLVTGPAAALTNQARLLTSGLSKYALSSKAVVGPLDSAPQLPGNETTIRKLGQPGVNAVALNPQVGIALDQTRLGRAAHNIRVHLQGSYTPLPNSIGGQLVATIGAETIARWPADASGVVDRWVDIPDRLLQRYTTLAVQVSISGNTGRCGEFQPITLIIDGESAVRSEPARPPVPGGFQSLPQALMPRVVIGIGDDRFGDTVRAVQIMTGLQRLSALPMDTSVVPLAEAVASTNPAVLISPPGWTDSAVTLPVSAPDAVPMTVNVYDDGGNATTLTLEPALKFASLQVIFDGRRSVLVATSNGAPAQLDELLTWLGADERRWSIVDGVALVSIAGRPPVTVTAPQPTAEPASTNTSSGAVWWWIGGSMLVIVLALTVWLRIRERRRIKGG
ncbi:hypothetical protein [Mycolicibacterium fluoranthenivorans]|uniref:Cellulose biosynthesis cyclic di-GMP-binding regulatory protein BcsB n=1 Tax=Mycolicibacterium fluoranthenivorans TaxID=258505 RepID=A0A7X5TX34_9MYCO|nr:hypothetical protein [Mycolicibacterium fluoranthenivorans]NIH94369.1 hypothetical protein [Mycolicibacterium fluoranthenivorans]